MEKTNSKLSVEYEFVCALLGAALRKYGSARQWLPLAPDVPKSLTAEQLESLLTQALAKGTVAENEGGDLASVMRMLRDRAAQLRKIDELPPEIVTSGRFIQPQMMFEVAPLPRTSAAFEEASKLYPVKIAFHGSQWANWWGILSAGLRNLSGRGDVTLREVFGSGVYVSTSWHVAKDFATLSMPEPITVGGLSKHQFSCMGVMEVAVSPAVHSHEEKADIPPTYLVVEHEGHVRLKYLLVYCSPSADLPVWVWPFLVLSAVALFVAWLLYGRGIFTKFLR